MEYIIKRMLCSVSLLADESDDSGLRGEQHLAMVRREFSKYLLAITTQSTVIDNEVTFYRRKRLALSYC